MIELRGDIPGVLRECSPVKLDAGSPGALRGIVLSDQGDRRRVAFWDNRAPDPMPASRLSLDLADPTGRFHARLWLAERGHNVGSEDRAEVLAWSVLSVWRGGTPIRLVLGRWWQQDSTWRRDGWRGTDKVTAAVGPTNTCGVEWEILTWFPNSTSRDAGHYGRNFANIEDAKAACDAAAIASRWAITNDDGSLTLPPLPGAS